MDEEILRAVNRFQYMTAAQVGRLLYPNQHDDNRYVQRRLRRLAQADYLLRLRELPTPRIGSAPLVAAELLCRRFQVSMPRLITERALKRMNIRVQPHGQDGRNVAVIPDAWFELQTSDDPVVAIALELDRGTEYQRSWRRKVASLTAWADGPYRSSFEADNLTVAVAAPTHARRDQLRTWTALELEAISGLHLAEIFLFTDASPVVTEPFDFFFSPLWYPAGQSTPVALLDLPEEAQADHGLS
ncbi:hypothetical protein ACFSNO_02970 [Streptomyces cirratus]|uniref:hypothetical protein n=1 Tax=Streptomyces cirratus TaxID=68187 RepID=UPI00167C74FD|nr:hypothetical protein [Streptomyces cirratus]